MIHLSLASVALTTTPTTPNVRIERLAADSKGKVHVSKRLDDTRRLLQDLHLEIDSFDADLHHTHRLVSARLVSPPRLPTPIPHPAIL